MTRPDDQFAELVRRGREVFAAAVSAWEQAARSLASGAASGAPTARMRDLGATVDAAFDFAGQMLAEQRNFAKSLMTGSGQDTGESAPPEPPVPAGTSDAPSRALESRDSSDGDVGTTAPATAPAAPAITPTAAPAPAPAVMKASPPQATERDTAAATTTPAAKKSTPSKTTATKATANNSTATNSTATKSTASRSTPPATKSGPADPSTPARKTPAKKASAATAPAAKKASAKKASARKASPAKATPPSGG